MDYYYEKFDGERETNWAEPCWGNLTKDEQEITTSCGVIYNKTRAEIMESLLKQAFDRHPLFKLYKDRIFIAYDTRRDQHSIAFDYRGLDIAHIKIVLQWLRAFDAYAKADMENYKFFKLHFPKREHTLETVYIIYAFYGRLQSFGYGYNSDMWQNMWESGCCVASIEYMRWCLGHPYAVANYGIKTQSQTADKCALAEEEYSISNCTFISRTSPTVSFKPEHQTWILRGKPADADERVLGKFIELVMAVEGPLCRTVCLGACDRAFTWYEEEIKK